MCRQDDVQTKNRPANSLLEAPWWSKLLFIWPYALLRLGLERPLTETDLPAICEQDSSATQLRHFEKIWNEEKKRTNKPNLCRVLLKDFLKEVWFVQPLMLIAATAKIAQAVALGNLIQGFQSKDDELASGIMSGSGDGYLWASIVTLCGLVLLFEHHHVFFWTWRKGMRLRISCLAAIYDKSLRLPSCAREEGHNIHNLASNDVERFLMASLFASYLFWSPVQSLAVLYVGYRVLGMAFVAGFAVLMAVFFPLQLYLGWQFAILRSRTAASTDARVTWMGQAIRGIRVVKVAAGYLEGCLAKAELLRKKEINRITAANRLKSWNEAVFFATNIVIGTIIFVTHVVVFEKELRSSDVFTVFVLINILQLEMTKHFSLGTMGVSECAVSVQRIQSFLESPELEVSEKDDKERTVENTFVDGRVMAFNDVTCYWDSPRNTQAALSNVTIDWKRLTVVIGPVGSGKSALLQAVIGELPIASGTSAIPPETRIAYASQDPWIMNGTVRENITMGIAYEEVWYNKVLEACGLSWDLRQWMFGDQTVLGENGVQCSGGQRARIGLARALYSDADLLVADDPLSAVDARVGRHIFEKAIQELVVGRGRSIILATHQHQYIHDCHCILMLDGCVACTGSYEDCVRASNGKLLAHASHELSAVAKEQTETTNDQALADVVFSEAGIAAEEAYRSDHKELRREGSVQFETYQKYLQAMGGPLVGIFLFLLFSATQGSVLVTIAIIARWAERPFEMQSDMRMISVVLSLCACVVCLGIIRAFLSFFLAVGASQKLHDRMTKAVLRAKVSFFDTNPLGRILNRFSADVGITDDQLPHTLYDFSMLAFLVLGALVTTVSTLPFVLLSVPFLGWYFFSVRQVFVTSSRELKRLEGLARSPIFAMLSESLGGISTIRPNGATGFFKEKFRDAHDTHTRSFFSFIASSRWVGFRMDSLLFVFVSIVSYASVLFNERGWFSVDPSILGLSLSVLLQLASLFQWCVRQSAEVVNQMVSTERVLGFCELEAEAPLHQDGDAGLLKSGWPQRGAVDVEGLCVRYRASLPLALSDLSFKIPPGSRLGVIGRTGSGKSTVVQSLFRLIEPDQGRILIDGVDIASLGLETLRNNISVIPQVPTLFSGCSVRENLDLFGRQSDDQIREVVESCHLKRIIDDLPDGLATTVAEGGSNFSVGQRQLFCLARALLNKTKILVLDEATANVDRRTDEYLQDAIKHTFQDGTIIAVAHRLDTIIDFDYCVVLGEGKVLEFGSPASLIRQGGAFASMLEDTGEFASAELRKRAFANEPTNNEDEEGI